MALTLVREQKMEKKSSAMQQWHFTQKVAKKEQLSQTSFIAFFIVKLLRFYGYVCTLYAHAMNTLSAKRTEVNACLEGRRRHSFDRTADNFRFNYIKIGGLVIVRSISPILASMHVHNMKRGIKKNKMLKYLLCAF